MSRYDRIIKFQQHIFHIAAGRFQLTEHIQLRHPDKGIQKDEERDDDRLHQRHAVCLRKQEMQQQEQDDEQDQRQQQQPLLQQRERLAVKLRLIINIRRILLRDPVPSTSA